ncbi:MAG: taurine dioxygenase [Planctomycetaceae bacterium]|jgi:taurine dioxygenase|nr:taurine dioxygenase [Planctomycetaceae bacterium]
MKPQTLELTQVTPHCGAEVRGIDLAQPLDDRLIEMLNTALAEHCVLFFRDQKMTPEQQKALGRHFGELHIHPAWPRLVEGHPEIMEIFADENTKRIAGEDWHSDVSCDSEPPLGTILYMLETPPVGGDTLFANMHAALDSLSTPMQRFLAGMTAVHDGEHVYRGRYDDMHEEGRTYPRSEHPVVRTHPVSGRQALFVNRIFTTRIVQLTQRESDAVLQMLFRHIEQPELQCRFHWQPGSVAFWDNRCAQHHALWDYYPNRRRGLRVTIKGDAPFYRADPSGIKEQEE